MAEPVRVVIDLHVTLTASAPIRPELAYRLAQAIDTFATEHLDPGDTIDIQSIRIPHPTQSFADAKELYRKELYGRWLRRKQRLDGP